MALFHADHTPCNPETRTRHLDSKRPIYIPKEQAGPNNGSPFVAVLTPIPLGSDSWVEQAIGAVLADLVPILVACEV